ncbi:hypothetical protein EVAR_62732_1 [Eumeta japonica]|uniref:Uncharacterized protein n=1 Tax=Eumeta variegata TaxID=151549 RepID=A0A4C1ZW97_EUMVA|nr:hypothetical protein EVAR_62732_1 [Eumeta japonica]
MGMGKTYMVAGQGVAARVVTARSAPARTAPALAVRQPPCVKTHHFSAMRSHAAKSLVRGGYASPLTKLRASSGALTVGGAQYGTYLFIGLPRSRFLDLFRIWSYEGLAI